MTNRMTIGIKKMTDGEFHKEISKELAGIVSTLKEIFQENRIGKIEDRIDKLEGKSEVTMKEKHAWIHGTRIGKLDWSEDLGKMDHNNAIKKCEEMGGRLPSRVELMNLYDNHREECKEMTGGYWSSTEFNSSNAWYVYFKAGSGTTTYKTNSFSVRCVREVKEEGSN